MGMPEIKCHSIDKCCAAASVLQSVALQEASLAHILNAEGEKLQKVIGLCNVKFEELMEANESVEATLDKVISLEIVLKGKIEDVLPLLKDCDKKSHECCGFEETDTEINN